MKVSLRKSLNRPEIDLETGERELHLEEPCLVAACCVLVSGFRIMLKFSYNAETNSGRLKWEKDA